MTFSDLERRDVRGNFFRRISLITSDIRKSSNDRSTLHASCVGDCSGDSAITEMWQMHYQQLYNSISDSDARDSVLQRTSAVACGKGDIIISIHDVVEASKKKCGKVIGMDGIAMEAFIHGGHRLHVHLSMMFKNVLKIWLCARFFHEEYNYTISKV